MIMPSIERIKAEHPDRWVAVEVTRVENGEAVEGKFILESEERTEVWDKVELPKKGQDREVYIFYTGAPLAKGYAAAF